MLNTGDKEWLNKRHPGLISDAESIKGEIAFSAAYNSQTGRFLILDDSESDASGGLVMSGAFTIKIEERHKKSSSSLPSLRVRYVEPIADRHFNQSNGIACLCSPLEEDEFLRPAFQFKRFLQELVIPFLYGQLFYSLYKRWPWPEYAHGATGLLESYAKSPSQTHVEECLRQLKLDASWARVKAALLQKSSIQGHTQCFCPKKDLMRRCHPNALRGVQMLQRDIKALDILIQ